jgi:glycosyltransferase involved in cell wall biosynthesis
MPDLTFVLPFRNEEGFLEATCESLAHQDLRGYSAEVLLIDGMSGDNSQEIALRYQERSGPEIQFRLVENPRLTAPSAFNIGIEESRSPIVGFGGAHTTYPVDYFRTVLDLVQKVPADVFGGGHTDFIPSRSGSLARAMACLYLSPLGAGVAPYHRRREPGYVDTVYGGFYKRNVFEKVGGFNLGLTRNQDNEFNARVRAAGFKVYFDPALSTKYVFKSDFGTFFQRGFRFGYYHPMTWKTNIRAFSLRHLVPAVFVAYLGLLAAMLVFFLDDMVKVSIAITPLLIYILLLGASGIQLARKYGVAVGLFSLPLFFGYHLSYGVGTFLGFRWLWPSAKSGVDEVA